MRCALHPLHLLACLLLLAVPTGALAQWQTVAMPDYQSGFPVALGASPVRLGSVTLADVDGDLVAEAVVAAVDGVVYAVNGSGTILWSYDTGAMAIESKPAVADLDGDGTVEVVVTAGSTSTPSSHGGLYVLSHLGALECEYQTDDDPDADTWREGVFSSPAVADLDADAQLEIAFGAWDRYVRVINADCSLLWETYVVDTVWSSPAIADLDGNDQLDVVIGADGDASGWLHAFNGATGTSLGGNFPIDIDEVIWSSPSVGDVDGDGAVEIVVGTGFCFADSVCSGGSPDPSVGNEIHAWNADGSVQEGSWPFALPNTYAFASPALVDVDGDGALEIVVNTIDRVTDTGQTPSSEAGRVYVIDGAGQDLAGWPVWPSVPIDQTVANNVHWPTKASPVVADLVGDGGLEVVLPCNWELVVWDDAGAQLSRAASPEPPEALQLRARHTMTGSAAIGDIDGDGDLEVVAGGAGFGGTPGGLFAWDFAAPVNNATPWPQFRRDARNTVTEPVVPTLVFSDGFEAGNLSGWSFSAP